MKRFWSSKDELLACLRSYTSVLEARKSALAELSRTSHQMRSTLQRSKAAEIDKILERREQDCRRYAAACKEEPPGGNALVDAARKAAENAHGELGRAARLALSLHADSLVLAEEIITCQNQCETILKERMAATALALRESSQRRKLDAAYGPACKHGSPVFLDKEQ